jgi:hypothetical protein
MGKKLRARFERVHHMGVGIYVTKVPIRSDYSRVVDARSGVARLARAGYIGLWGRWAFGPSSVGSTIDPFLPAISKGN